MLTAAREERSQGIGAPAYRRMRGVPAYEGAKRVPENSPLVFPFAPSDPFTAANASLVCPWNPLDARSRDFGEVFVPVLSLPGGL